MSRRALTAAGKIKKEEDAEKEAMRIRAKRKAFEQLDELERLLNDRIEGLFISINACKHRADPGANQYVSARHSFMLYRELVHRIKSNLGHFNPSP